MSTAKELARKYLVRQDGRFVSDTYMTQSRVELEDLLEGALVADPRRTAPLAALIEKWRKRSGEIPTMGWMNESGQAAAREIDDCADELEAALALAGKSPAIPPPAKEWTGIIPHRTPAEWVRVGLEAAALVAEDEWKLDAHEEGHREFCAKYGTADVEEAIRAIDAAALVDRAGEEPADKDALAKWMIEHSFATGHGETIADLLEELSWQVRKLRERNQSETDTNSSSEANR
jgi:hypothetical protein